MFAKGAHWRLSFLHEDDALNVLEAIRQDGHIGYGMRILEASPEPPPALQSPYRFLTDLCPVITYKPRRNGSREFILWKNPESDELLTTSLRRRLAAAGYSDEDRQVSIRFDRSFRRAHSKLCALNGEKIRGSICPIIASGTPAALQFAWMTGVGEYTEYGFGALR